MFRLLYALLASLTLCACPGMAELIPLGDWPGDGTRTALEVNGRLFRNCGRILERWDLNPEPPALLDSLVLDSSPIDLLAWDDLLLVLRDDGVLEAREMGDWEPPIWTMELSECATELLRHDHWLLPVSPWMPLLDLANPRAPIVSEPHLGMGGDWPGNFGGYHAAFVGDTLIGDYSDCCGACWDVVMGACWMTLGPDGTELPSAFIEPVEWWPWEWDSPIATASHLGLVSTGNTLSCFDSADWSLRQTMVFPDNSGAAVLAAEDSLVMAASNQVCTLMRVSQATDPPVQVLDSIAVAGGRQLRLMGDHALSVSDELISWIDLANPNELLVASELPAMGSISGVGRSGDHLLVRQRDLRVLQSQGGQLLPVASLVLPEGDGLAVSGRLTLAGADSVLFVVDLVDPLSPVIVAQIAAPGLERFCLDDGLAAFVTQGDLVIVTLEQPGQPIERLRLPVGEVLGLAVGGGIVAVAEDRQTIRLISARDPEHVHEAGTLPWEAGWNHEAIAFCGSRLALAWETYVMPGYPCTHLVLYDLVDPSQARSAGSRLWDGYVLEGLWGGAERLLIGVRLTMIFSTPPDYFLLDDLENDNLAQTAHWIEPFGSPVPVWSSCPGGWLVRHDEGDGLRLFLDDSIVDVNGKPAVLPERLSLSAAPNPFNPRTVLDFTLVKPGTARLAVYDLMGREVAVLLEGHQPAGARQVVFDGDGLASGLYLARLETAQGAGTVKLALLR